MPRANRRRTPPQFLPGEISKFSDAIMEKINSKTVQGPSKPGQHLLICLRHRELGIRTKNASNMEIFDCVLRTPSRCYRTTDEISGTKMVYSKRGHLVQCHPNPTLFSKDNLYKKWECFQYLPGEKYRAHHFVDVPYDSQKNTASESYLVIRTSFERLFFIDCENELVLKVYQLPNTNFFTYTGFVYSVLENELYIKGTKKAGRLEEQPIVAVFELSPIRLKMFYEMERQSVYDYIISVFDGYLASYTAGKFQVHDLDEIYKQHCFDIDELPPVDGVIPVKRNVHVRTVDPSLNIEGEMNENMRFLGGVLFLDRLLTGQSNKFRSLKDPTVNLSLESRCSSSEIGAVLMPIDESQMAGVSYESRTFAFKGTLVSCYNIENRTGTKLYCNKCWSQDFGFPAVSFSFSNELNGEDFLQCSSAFQQLYTEGPHVYIAMEYSMVNLLDGSQCSSTAIFVTSLETGEILKTLLVDVTPKSHYSSIETRSLMLTDEGEICYQSQEYDGVTTISLFSLTDQEALNDTEKKLKKATASVERGLNRRQRRQQRRNTSAT